MLPQDINTNLKPWDLISYSIDAKITKLNYELVNSLSVVELFLLGKDNKYLEVELCPWVSLCNILKQFAISCQRHWICDDSIVSILSQNLFLFIYFVDLCSAMDSMDNLVYVYWWVTIMVRVLWGMSIGCIERFPETLKKSQVHNKKSTEK